MKTQALSTAAVALTLLTCSVQQAQALPVEARFTATVTGVSDRAGLPAVGSTISGTYTFDNDPTLQPFFRCPDLSCALYEYAPAVRVGAVLDLGASVLTSSGLGVSVYDNTFFQSPTAPRDGIDFGSRINGLDYILALNAPIQTFSSTGLPSIGELSGPWTQSYFTVRSFANTFELNANVTSVMISAVPEPSSWALFALGLLTLTVGARRHHRSTASAGIHPA